jgi:hypothetical protein
MTDTMEKTNILADAIASAWDGADSNEQAAANLLAAMKRDTALYAAAMHPVEREIAQRLVGQHKRAARNYIWSRPSQPDNRVAALARSNAVTLLDMRLPSGKRLGEATRAEVMEAAAEYRAAKEYHASKERFFNAVADKVADGKRVADVLTAADLEAMKDA